MFGEFGWFACSEYDLAWSGFDSALKFGLCTQRPDTLLVYAAGSLLATLPTYLPACLPSREVNVEKQLTISLLQEAEVEKKKSSEKK